MVTIFPELFTYGFLAAGVLRMTIGIIFIYFAYEMFFRERREPIALLGKLKPLYMKVLFATTAVLVFITGAGLLVGFYMQIAALVAGTLMTVAVFTKWYNPSALPRNTIEFYIILAVTSFALVFMGPGAFAFDLAV